MKEKIKNWLLKADEEGINNFDAIYASLRHLMAWSLLIIGGLWFR